VKIIGNSLKKIKISIFQWNWINCKDKTNFHSFTLRKTKCLFFYSYLIFGKFFNVVVAKIGMNLSDRVSHTHERDLNNVAYNTQYKRKTWFLVHNPGFSAKIQVFYSRNSTLSKLSTIDKPGFSNHKNPDFRSQKNMTVLISACSGYTILFNIAGFTN